VSGRRGQRAAFPKSVRASVDLASICAADGAFFAAASSLEEAAAKMRQHAESYLRGLESYANEQKRLRERREARAAKARDAQVQP
jgi:hypothetical protein